MAHDATRPQRLWLIGTPGRDRRRLRVQVRTQSKSIECSFNVVSIVLPQCRFNVVYSADRPLLCHGSLLYSYAHVSLVFIKSFWEKLFSTDVVETGIERLIVG